jgi:hypothetical protein
VQVPYDEGVAIHIGPESCAVAREGLGEALTGVRQCVQCKSYQRIILIKIHRGESIPPPYCLQQPSSNLTSFHEQYCLAG